MTFESEGSGVSAPGPSVASYGVIDTSRVVVESTHALPAGATSQASFVLPNARRSQPFRAHRAGYGDDLAHWAAATEFGVEIVEVLERPLLDGRLHVASVRQRVAADRIRSLTLAAFEHDHGCILTSRHGTDVRGLARLMATLPFRASATGCALALPVDASIRPPALMIATPSTVCFVRPYTRAARKRLPRAAGMRTQGGELFRARRGLSRLLLVTETAIVDVQPVAESQPVSLDASVDAETLAFATDLRATWNVS
jgi:hypothetical protein